MWLVISDRGLMDWFIYEEVEGLYSPYDLWPFYDKFDNHFKVFASLEYKQTKAPFLLDKKRCFCLRSVTTPFVQTYSYRLAIVRDNFFASGINFSISPNFARVTALNLCILSPIASRSFFRAFIISWFL